MCEELQFEILYIGNPLSSLLYSDIHANIWATDDQGIIFDQTQIPLYYETPSTRFTPHPFASANVVGANSSTIKITNYTFTFINQDFAIPSGEYRLMIATPPGMIFTRRPPRVTVHSGIDSQFGASNSHNQLIIMNGFDEGLPADSNITFMVDDIQNPYEIYTVPRNFWVYIYIGNSLLESYFSHNSEFSVNIDTISQFSSFQVTLDSYTVSENSYYYVRFQLGDGIFKKDHYLEFIYPSDIKDCAEETIYLNQQSTNCPPFYIDNIYKYAYPDRRMVGFKSVQCDNTNGTIMELKVICRSPETTKPTGDFGLQIQSDNYTETSIYYYSMGSPVQMTKGTFLGFTYIMLNRWMDYPNKFSFSIERVSPHDSSHIDQVSIIIPAQLSMNSCPIISNTDGMSATGRFEISCTAQIIYIASIASLSQIFGFTLNNIKNPSEPIIPIYFTAETSNSEGYYGESGTSISQYANCAYPCYTCTPDLITNCTACYSLDNNVFEGGISMHRYHLTTESIGICSNKCPSHTYESSPTLCAHCNVNCDECSIIPTNCTKCSDAFLHNYKCIPTCPEGYSNNVDEWTCTEIKSFEIYSNIYIPTNELEIEKLAVYIFTLYPEEELKFRDSKLEITSPPSINVGNSCESTLGTCSISGSLITLTSILTADYVVGDAPIVATINNTYINPGVSYLLSETLFTIKTKINATIYHSIILPVSDPDPLITRYIPHILGGTSPLSYTSSTTVTLSTLSFNISNIEYPIPMGHKIILTFPNRDIWLFNSGLNRPTYSPMESLNNSLLGIIIPSTIIIEGIFTEVVPPDSDIRFNLNYILNPYALGQTLI